MDECELNIHVLHTLFERLIDWGTNVKTKIVTSGIECTIAVDTSATATTYLTVIVLLPDGNARMLTSLQDGLNEVTKQNTELGAAHDPQTIDEFLTILSTTLYTDQSTFVCPSQVAIMTYDPTQVRIVPDVLHVLLQGTVYGLHMMIDTQWLLRLCDGHVAQIRSSIMTRESNIIYGAPIQPFPAFWEPMLGNITPESIEWIQVGSTLFASPPDPEHPDRNARFIQAIRTWIEPAQNYLLKGGCVRTKRRGKGKGKGRRRKPTQQKRRRTRIKTRRW